MATQLLKWGCLKIGDLPKWAASLWLPFGVPLKPQTRGTRTQKGRPKWPFGNRSFGASEILQDGFSVVAKAGRFDGCNLASEAKRGGPLRRPQRKLSRNWSKWPCRRRMRGEEALEKGVQGCLFYTPPPPKKKNRRKGFGVPVGFS